MNYAVVEKNSNRAIAIVDGALAEWFKQNMPAYDVLEIESVGSASLFLHIIPIISIFEYLFH